MCGIAGIIDPKRGTPQETLEQIVTRMTDRLVHRGPDDSGTHVDEKTGVSLGFRRLSIQDLSPAGAQPMSSASGRYVTVYNGEIYNFRELRRELERDGVRQWRGHSDTEVMLAMVERHGFEETLAQLDGMFAIALYDREKGKLYLARDRMGEKPLYYGWSGSSFVFASELKALTVCPGWSGEVDRDALNAYMRFAYVPGSHSIYRGIRKLAPGHLLNIDLENLTPSVQPAADTFWNARSEAEAARRSPFEGSDEEAADQLGTLLTHSIGRRLISDVPLGVFLSGGIDSSTVAAIAQKISSAPIKTFTIGFEDKRFDESEQAAAVAGHLGTDHTELTAEADAPLRLVERMPQVYDEPFADVSQLPTMLLAELTRQHVTVALTGDGGDELFVGYPRYKAANKHWLEKRGVLARTWGRLGMIAGIVPNVALNAVSVGRRPWRLGDKMYRLSEDGLAGTPEETYEAFMSRWRTASRPCPEPDIGYYADPSQHPRFAEPIDRMSYADAVSYLPDDLLVKVDRATMAVGLEGRAPLLDHEIVRFAWSLPLGMKLKDGEMKRPLRCLLDRHVPKQLFDKPKQGFEPPLGDWLRGPLREWAEALLTEKALRDGDFLDPSPVRAVWREHLDGVRDWRFELWNVLMFQAWRQAWRV
jgi:asparagine synthase (glutamine-hydrolysing)